MRVLISGTSSGFGKYLLEKINYSEAVNRNFEPSFYKNEHFDVIIHCAFNKTMLASSDNLYECYNDNILLTEKLSRLNCKKFIFLSTVDVYPKKYNKAWSTDDKIFFEDIDNSYGKFKLLCEKIIEKNCKNYYIIRVSSLVGKYMKHNSYLKIMNEEFPKLTLSGESRFSFLEYEKVLNHINLSITKDSIGTVNLVSDKYVILNDLAREINKKVNFGDHLYLTPFVK